MKTTLLPPTHATKGFSTIELLIAFSVGIIFLTAAMMVGFSDSSLTQQTSLDSGQAAVLNASLDNYGLSTSTKKFGNAVRELMKNWNYTGTEVQSDTQVINSGLSYTNTPTITDISPCLKEVIDTTSWGGSHSMTFGTAISNIDIAKGLGGDCDPMPIGETWNKPKVFSSHNFNPGKPVAMDVLNRVVYITDDKSKLQIYNSASDVLGSNAGFSITPYTDAGNKTLNDIDVAKIGTHRYAFVVRNDTTAQFQVIDVTTPGTYTSSPTKTLGGTTPPTGSFPQGWRVFYFDNKAYVTTRETAGYEFHSFDVSTPLSPTEVGPGYEVNGTVNDITITSMVINGHTYKLAFLATDRSANEIMVLNITTNTPTLLASVDIPTGINALSIQLIGNKLYVGRQKTAGGPELLVYSVAYGESGSNPTVTLSTISSGAEINMDVAALRIAGKFAFVGDPLPNEFSVWDISHPTTSFPRVDITPLNISNKVSAIDYEAPYVYAVSQANDALQILYSAP
jgi:type II secretory pathway pseudopilin PulG